MNDWLSSSGPGAEICRQTAVRLSQFEAQQYNNLKSQLLSEYITNGKAVLRTCEPWSFVIHMLHQVCRHYSASWSWRVVPRLPCCCCQCSAVLLPQGTGRSRTPAAVCSACLIQQRPQQEAEVAKLSSRQATGRSFLDHCAWFEQTPLRFEEGGRDRV